MSNQRKSVGNKRAKSGGGRSSGRLLGLLSALLMFLQGLIASGGVTPGATVGEGRSALTASLFRSNCVRETGRHDAPSKDVAHHGQCCIACDSEEYGESISDGGTLVGATAIPDFGGSILFEGRAPDMGERLTGWLTSWSSRAPPLFP
ncbi:hypothetical protein AMST5_02854 [freshwater sediment metagenome]|uniref:Uncharacterized protein n=1 Tax=freshwater sediment metagenome TaxID=556182 RepID=A0AA48RE02_9ZZZZ